MKKISIVQLFLIAVSIATFIFPSDEKWGFCIILWVLYGLYRTIIFLADR